MDAKLVVVSGESPASEYALNLPVIVGRSRTADIKIGHALVSRKHCELYESDGQLAVRDLGSLNGTFVGDSRISDATLLPPGGMVTIGAVTFQAVYGDMSEPMADAEKGELPDFMSAPDVPARRATAAPMEQTLEMSDSAAPGTEPTSGGDRDAGIDFGWLEEPGEVDDQPQAKAATNVVKAVAAVTDLQQPAEEDELSFSEPMVAGEYGAAAGEANEFAPPPQQAATGGDDEDLSDFFASLK